MKQRLILVNLLIAGGIAWCGYEIRQRMEFVRQRDAMAARQAASPVPPAKSGEAAPPAAQVAPAGYIDVAQKMLFSRDRNSQVEIVIPPKPPEKPLPPLPVARGVMNLGDGPIVLMAEKEQSRFLPVRPGQSVGPYTLARLDGDQLTLTWEDKTVVKRLGELRPKVETAVGPVAGAQGVTPPDRPPPVVAPAPPKPGVELTGSIRACVAGDASPPGTVNDGYRKIVTKTPFGESCRWELIK